MYKKIQDNMSASFGNTVMSVSMLIAYTYILTVALDGIRVFPSNPPYYIIRH